MYIPRSRISGSKGKCFVIMIDFCQIVLRIGYNNLHIGQHYKRVFSHKTNMKYYQIFLFIVNIIDEIWYFTLICIKG